MSASGNLGPGRLLAYGALGLPLAMAALPVYVHVPKLYGGVLGLDLALVGGILMAVRLLDAFQDPLLGVLSDRHGARKGFIALALPLLALGMVALFSPPETHLAVWLAGSLVLVYLGFSLASISYQAWGAELGGTPHERTRITASREGLALLGVLLAAALPEVLAGGRGEAAGLSLFSLLFLPLLAVAAGLTLGLAPAPPRRGPAAPGNWLRGMLAPLSRRSFRQLAAVFLLNGIAAAIPATLVLFFVEDVLAAPQLAGAFLAVYFLAGAAGMPAWVAASRRIGKGPAWVASMLLAVAAFVWAYTLGRGDTGAFFVICALSGLALGGDLALAPSLLADVIEEEEGPSGRAAGAYFGIWNFLNKLNLALAAGVALPLLAWLGYQPGSAQAGTAALSMTYALLPSALKLAAAALLVSFPARAWGLAPELSRRTN